MEYAEIALAVFTASGFTYGTIRSYRLNRTPKPHRELPVILRLRAGKEPVWTQQCVVLVFDNRGYLLRKFPQVECTYRNDWYRIKCTVQRGEFSFCVLLADKMLNLSGILKLEDVRRLYANEPSILIAESGIQQVMLRNNVYELNVASIPVEEEVPDTLPMLADVLPSEVVTDAMAKELVVNLQKYTGEWTPGVISYQQTDSNDWLSAHCRNRTLILQMGTNFTQAERSATVELRTTSGEVLQLPVQQRRIGEHPTLSVSQRVSVTPGFKNEAIELTVVPDSLSSQWSIRKIETSDGGRWWNVQPQVGTPLIGIHTLRVHLESKPANVVSRSALVTLETGTYPFNQITDVCLTQGICFDYYIEYPANDPCARHTEVIETPLCATDDDMVRSYTIRVESNQPWRVADEKMADWIQVSEIDQIPGSHGGIFTIQVSSNARYRVQNGFPAARHTTLSLINETGIVRDIFIYQGGYVRIRGILWLDRNLSFAGTLPAIAIPLGLAEEEKRRTWGSYFQFGKHTDEWQGTSILSTENWNSGTEETPGKCPDIDPSPKGWRVPSRLELSTLLNRQTFHISDQLKGNGSDYICLLSDDGVPFFLPLCGHLSHINGHHIQIVRGNRYWCGTSQSPIYGYSLCIEPNRQMSIVHDIKKYGFPLRCVLETLFVDIKEQENEK